MRTDPGIIQCWSQEWKTRDIEVIRIWKWVQEKFSEKNDSNYLPMNQVWYGNEFRKNFRKKMIVITCPWIRYDIKQYQNPSYLRIILQSLVCTGSIWEIESSFYSGCVSQSHDVSALDSKLDIWIMKYFMEFHDVFLMIFFLLWVNWLLLD